MPALKSHGLFARTLADDWSIFSTSTFVAGSPATHAQHTRPTIVGRSTDTTAALPTFIHYDVNNEPQPADQVWRFEDVGGTDVFVDETFDFNSSIPNSVLPFPATEAINDYFAIGFRQPFGRLTIDVGTVGTVGVVAWEYSKAGGAWGTLGGVVDNTNGFKISGVNTVSYNRPVDWVPVVLNGSKLLYYIRARVTTVYTINPKLNEGAIELIQIDPTRHVMMPLYVSSDGSDIRWRLRFSRFSDLSSPDLDTGVTGLTFARPWGNRNSAHAFNNPFDQDPTIPMCRFWGIDIWAAKATFIDIGRIYAAIPLQPGLGIERRSQVPTPAEAPRRILGSRGESYSVPGKIYQGARIGITFKDEAEAQSFADEIFARRGTNRDLLYIDDPTDSANLQQKLVYGRLDRRPEILQTAPLRWRVSLPLSEVR